LLLAGHTHGGQVAPPWLGPLVLPPLGRRYVRGWHATPAGPLYVSRGLGAVPPFVRLNAPPEVSLLTLARGGTE
jgi:predicted MPP superfamily phosphohydrolase